MHSLATFNFGRTDSSSRNAPIANGSIDDNRPSPYGEHWQRVDFGEPNVPHGTLGGAKWSISQLMTRFHKRKRVPCFGTPKHAFEYESMAPIIQIWSLFVKRTTKSGEWDNRPSPNGDLTDQKGESSSHRCRTKNLGEAPLPNGG
jgi:hypothetical protein